LPSVVEKAALTRRWVRDLNDALLSAALQPVLVTEPLLYRRHGGADEGQKGPVMQNRPVWC